jgi:hypothetical protein
MVVFVVPKSIWNFEVGYGETSHTQTLYPNLVDLAKGGIKL